MSITAHLERRWQTDSVAVFILDDHPAGGKRVLHIDRGAYEWANAYGKDGEATAPTIELPRDALEALVAAASDFTPPSSAMGDHLADTIKTRDALLELVSRGIPGPNTISAKSPPITLA